MWERDLLPAKVRQKILVRKQDFAGANVTEILESPVTRVGGERVVLVMADKLKGVRETRVRELVTNREPLPLLHLALAHLNDDMLAARKYPPVARKFFLCLLNLDRKNAREMTRIERWTRPALGFSMGDKIATFPTDHICGGLARFRLSHESHHGRMVDMSAIAGHWM